MASSKTPEQLAKWANSQDWNTHIGQAEVAAKMGELHSLITGEGGSSGTTGGGSSDPSGAARIKLVVVGDGAVGKTSLLIVKATGKFPTEYTPTVFENYTAQMERHGRQILLHLWDTAGQEDYDRLRPLSYPGSDIVLLCFSTVSKTSFDAVRDKWSPEVQHYVPEVPHLLVGTKIDLRDAGTPDPVSGKNDPVTPEMAEKLRAEVDAISYHEICAMDGRGMEELFDTAVQIVLQARGEDQPLQGNANDLKATALPVKKKKSGGCVLS